MTKLVTALGGAGVAALGVVLAVAIAGTGGSPARTTTAGTTAETTTAGTTTARTTTVGTTTAGTTTAAETATTAVDVSGPCDEAEHRNDPRCTGVAAGQGGRDGDDHRGRGRGRGSDDDHEDRSGSNSGRG